MIRDGLINKKEGIEILENFLERQCSFEALAELYKIKKYFLTLCSRTEPELRNFVKNKFRELLLEMEYHLCRMGHIESLKIYDHASDKLFD